jgi:hypothetical protein
VGSFAAFLFGVVEDFGMLAAGVVATIAALLRPRGIVLRARKFAMQTLKAGALYFAVVFGAGVALGTLRVLWVVPRLGTRTAELREAPVMLAVTVFAARWIVRRLEMPSIWTRRLSMGYIALAFLLIAAFTLVLGVRGLSIREYCATLDPVAGSRPRFWRRTARGLHRR